MHHYFVCLIESSMKSNSSSGVSPKMQSKKKSSKEAVPHNEMLSKYRRKPIPTYEMQFIEVKLCLGSVDFYRSYFLSFVMLIDLLQSGGAP